MQNCPVYLPPPASARAADLRFLALPTGEPTSICFGDVQFDTLYVTSGGRLYHRKMKAMGAPAFARPTLAFAQLLG